MKNLTTLFIIYLLLSSCQSAPSEGIEAIQRKFVLHFGNQLFIKMPYGPEVWQYQVPNLNFQKTHLITSETAPKGFAFKQNKNELREKAFQAWQQETIYYRLIPCGV